MQLQDFLKRLKGEQRGSGEQYMACCPAHGDTKPSLSVTERDGKILVHCQAGCTTEAVISAMGLTMQDLFVEPKPKPQSWIFLREHIYYNENSEPIAKKQLYDKGDGTKTGIWYRYENGNYIKGLNGLRMPLYNLPVLTDKEGAYIAGGENSTVYIAEGEKDAQTLFDMGYAGTTSPNGAGSKWKTEYNKYVAGRDVVILADNDKAGINHAEHTADALLTVAKSVKLIPSSAIYSDIQNKGDISDIVAKFGTATAKEMLDKAVAAASYINTYSQAPSECRANKISPRSGTVKRDLVLLHPDKNDRYGWHDMGNGFLFADWYKDKARYVPERKKWFIYNGKVWKPDAGDLKVMELCKELADDLMIYALSLQDEKHRQEYMDFIKKWQKRNFRETIIKDATSVYPIEMTEFDADPMYFNCQNGTLNLETREFHAHRAGDLLSKISNVVYNPEAKSERWERFINEIMQGNADKAMYLQKALGYEFFRP